MLQAEGMRALLTLLACLMLAVTALNGTAQAAASGCGEMAEQMAVHVAGDCDEVPADADRNYPHCHTGCHGHHIAAPVAGDAPARPSDIRDGYPAAPPVKLGAHQADRTLRPPQA